MRQRKDNNVQFESNDFRGQLLVILIVVEYFLFKHLIINIPDSLITESELWNYRHFIVHHGNLFLKGTIDRGVYDYIIKWKWSWKLP